VGEAKRRGTFEERRELAIYDAEVKKLHEEKPNETRLPTASKSILPLVAGLLANTWTPTNQLTTGNPRIIIDELSK
jgi:hypothetical protein